MAPAQWRREKAQAQHLAQQQMAVCVARLQEVGRVERELGARWQQLHELGRLCGVGSEWLRHHPAPHPGRGTAQARQQRLHHARILGDQQETYLRLEQSTIPALQQQLSALRAQVAELQHTCSQLHAALQRVLARKPMLPFFCFDNPRIHMANKSSDHYNTWEHPPHSPDFNKPAEHALGTISHAFITWLSDTRRTASAQGPLKVDPVETYISKLTWFFMRVA